MHFCRCFLLLLLYFWMTLADGSGLSFWSTLCLPSLHHLLNMLALLNQFAWRKSWGGPLSTLLKVWLYHIYIYIYIYRTLWEFGYFLNDNFFLLSQLILITFTPSFKTYKWYRLLSLAIIFAVVALRLAGWCQDKLNTLVHYPRTLLYNWTSVESGVKRKTVLIHSPGVCHPSVVNSVLVNTLEATIIILSSWNLFSLLTCWFLCHVRLRIVSDNITR